MDSWAARVHRHIPPVQYARLSNFGGRHIFTEDEGGDEVRAWFPCPFCYVEIEVPLLCVHLQDEHCFGLKNAVCPICAANLGKDPLSHFTMQHAHSIKPRKKSQKSGFWSNGPTNAVKDFREESWFVGSYSSARPGSGNEPAPDRLLSPFLCNVPKGGEENVSSCDVAASDEQRAFLPSGQRNLALGLTCLMLAENLLLQMKLKKRTTKKKFSEQTFLKSLYFQLFFKHFPK